MAISNVDNSSTELSRLKRSYENSLQDMKTAQKMEIDKMQENQEAQHKKEAEMYGQAKAKLENEFNNRVESIRDNTADKINEQRFDYLENLRNQKVDFEKDQNNYKTEINRRLRDISDSFRRSSERELESHNAVQENTLKNYGKRSKVMQDQQDKQVGMLQEKTKNFQEETKAERTKERDELYKGHQVDMQDLKKIETKRRLEEVGNKDVAIRDLKDFYKNGEENLIRSHDNTLNSYKKKNQENFNDLQNKFNVVTENLREKAVADGERMRKDGNEKLKDKEKEFEKDKNFLNRKISDISKSNSLEKEMKDGKGEFSKEGEYLTGYKSSLDKIKNDYYKKSEQMRKSYKDEISDVKNRAEERETKTLSDLSDYSTRQNARNVKERNEVVDFYKRQIERDNQNYETNLDERKKFDDARFRDSLVNFNKKIQEITDKNYETLAKVREEYTSKHKQETATKEASYLESLNLNKQSAAAKLRDQEAVMNERLKLKDKEIQSIVESYETTLKSLEAAKVKEDRYKEFAFDQKRNEDIEAFRFMNEKKTNEFGNRMDQMRIGYEIKIDEIQKDHSRQIKQLLNDQKEKIDNLEKEKFYELKRMEKKTKMDIEKNNVKYQDELNRIVNTYEARILQLKDNVAAMKYKNSSGKDLA